MARHIPRLALWLAVAGWAAPTAAAAMDQPRLIVQITVDALRGDLPNRFAHVTGDGGFRYLKERGVNYASANYAHANTETIVGHASLATGTVPAAHGMVGNVWFDRAQDRLVYNIEDPDYHLLTVGAGVDQGTEIDPTQKRPRSMAGRLPRSCRPPSVTNSRRTPAASRRSSPYR
jgi:predicted AlkP superfamily pyrophosphatase or phosphodiesterase